METVCLLVGVGRALWICEKDRLLALYASLSNNWRVCSIGSRASNAADLQLSKS